MSDCSWRTSRLGLLLVKLRASGAMKMVFSVFASTEATSAADRANREVSVWDSFIVVAIEELKVALRQGNEEIWQRHA